MTIQIGCDNSCAFCIVPAVRGPEISRPLAELVAEVEALAAEGVTEVTLLGQNVNSYGRDLTLAARQAGGTDRVRPLFADLLRAVGGTEGIRRVRFTSPHPKDLRPDTIEAMATTGAVCEHLHLPLQAGSDRTLAAMHRGYTADRYLERLAAARAAIPDLAVTTDLIVGFPGETDDDFERTLEVVAEARVRQRVHVHLLAAAGHRGRGDARSVRGRGCLRRSVRAAESRGRAFCPSSPLGARGSCRGGRRRRPEQARPRGHHGPHAPEQARALRCRHSDQARHVRDGPGHGRRASSSAGRAGRGPRACSPSHPARGGRRLSASSASPLLAIVGPTATGKSALALSVARHLGGLEIVSVDSMQVYRGMDIGTAKPSLADRAEVAHHLVDVAEPSEAFTVVRFQHEYDVALAVIDAHAHRRAARRGNWALPARGDRSPRPPR